MLLRGKTQLYINNNITVEEEHWPSKIEDKCEKLKMQTHLFICFNLLKGIKEI